MSREEVIKDILLLFNNWYPNSRIFKRNVGAVKIDNRWIKFGVRGQADLWGWIVVNDRPIHLEIEVKVKRDELKPDQEHWKNLCIENRIIYAVCRDGDFRQLCKEINRQIRRLS